MNATLTDARILDIVKTETDVLDDYYYDGNLSPVENVEHARAAAGEALVLARAALRRLKNANINHHTARNPAYDSHQHAIAVALARVCEEIYDLHKEAWSVHKSLRSDGDA